MSGEAFRDTRLAPLPGPIDVRDGGAVEVFCNPAEAAARAAALPRHGESVVTHGDIVLRLSTRLTPHEIAAYRRGLE